MEIINLNCLYLQAQGEFVWIACGWIARAGDVAGTGKDDFTGIYNFSECGHSQSYSVVQPAVDPPNSPFRRPLSRAANARCRTPLSHRPAANSASSGDPSCSATIDRCGP